MPTASETQQRYAAYALLAIATLAVYAQVHDFEFVNVDDPDLLLNLGNALAAQGDTHGAMARYQRALAANPNLALAHNNLGYLLAREGEAEGAIAHYQQALRMGRADEAIGHLDKALEANPGFAQAKSKLAAAKAIRDATARQGLPQ